MLKLNEKSAKSTYIILALSIIMLVIVGIRLYSDTYAAFMQKDIASQIIRFHIRANDDFAWCCILAWVVMYHHH